MTGVYLYAVVIGEPATEFGPIGLPDGTTPVRVLSATGSTAVVSEYEGASFDNLPQAELLRRLIIHQQVLEHVMERVDSPLLPVKFGTVLASLDDVKTVLTRFHRRFESASEEIGNSVEINLSATWDLATVFAEIGREPAIAQLASVAGDRQSGDALGARIQVGVAVQQALQRRREEYRRQIVDTLGPLTRGVLSNPVPSDDVVLNEAFLVERTQLQEFEPAVDRLGERYEDRLAFRFVGPLPPHSFATVEISRPDPNEIEAALQVLGLGTRISEADLRGAYRDMASRYHPDRNPGDGSAAERFAAISAAYRSIESYLEGSRTDSDALDPNAQHDLASQSLQNALLLTIARADSAEAAVQDIQYEPDPAR